MVSSIKIAKRSCQVLLLSLCCFNSSLLLADQPPFEEGGMSPILDTIINFYEYIQETLDDIEEKGGERDLTIPQWDDSPGWGPISVITENTDTLGIDMLGPLVIFDVPPIPLDLGKKATIPEVPATDRMVVGVSEDGFTKPHIPPLRWTADGRVGVESQVGGTVENPSPVSLYLLAPEKLSEPFADTAPGPHAMILDRVTLPFDDFAKGHLGTVQHTNICDPYTTDEGTRKNPYACGESGEDDCYDVTLVSSYLRISNQAPRMHNGNRLMGTPMHIRVSNPKTTQATVAEVTFGEPTFSKGRTDVLFETLTPADGRIFVARRGFTPLVWQNTATKETQLGSYDIVYAVTPPESDPCDVTDWSDLYPITHAPYDERVNQRYLFAAQPFRDPGGEIIPDGVDIKGTYPWMDKEAKMFSMQVAPGKLFPRHAYDGNPMSRFPVRCYDEEECDVAYMRDSDNSKDNLYVIVGAWTQGKMVLLDGLLNDLDFRLGGRDRDHSYISIYEPGTGKDSESTGEKRVGSTRGGPGVVPVKDKAGEVVGNYATGNISMFDSVENRLNYVENIKHSKPYDVVWNMSSGHSTEEFAFDDYLTPDGFIVSNMVGHLKHKNSRWYKMDYYDGWHQLLMNFSGEVRVQNSATSLPSHWLIPEYGRVYNGRLEPVANGGVRGKGLWFNGNNTRIEYTVREQPQDVLTKDWYYGLFIEPRLSDDDVERVLVRFPDNSKLTLVGLDQLKLSSHQEKVVATLDLPASVTELAWSHLGLLVHAADETGSPGKLEIFLDGFLFWQSNLDYGFASFAESNLGVTNFRPVAGRITVGDDVAGKGLAAYHGWMDEFKAFAYEPNLESICNYAHGTIVGLTETTEDRWQDLADRYEQTSHDKVTTELALYGQTGSDRYVCYHDYSGDDLAHTNNLPANTIALRDRFHFPEGPLYHDVPRPDSSANEFCHTCHHKDGIGGLDLEALELRGMDAKYDHRRQPLQPPAKVYGSIPANWLPGSANDAFDSGPEGVWIDEWILGSAEGSTPEILNLVFADSEGDGVALIEDVAYNKEQLDSEITTIRANADGLVRSVTFTVNGETVMSEQVPFVLDLTQLQEGENQILVQGQLDDGLTQVLEKTITLNF